MKQYTRQRFFSAGNPLTNALLVIVGAGALVIAFILGVFALLTVSGIVLVMASIIGIRVWWHGRRISAHNARPPTDRPSSGGNKAIEGEFQVVDTEKEHDSSR